MATTRRSGAEAAALRAVAAPKTAKAAVCRPQKGVCRTAS
jgi:hypothetical protein